MQIKITAGCHYISARMTLIKITANTKYYYEEAGTLIFLWGWKKALENFLVVL